MACCRVIGDCLFRWCTTFLFVRTVDETVVARPFSDAAFLKRCASYSPLCFGI